MRTKFLIILGAILFLAGCSSSPFGDTPYISRSASAMQAEQQLAGAANSINKSLLELAAIKRAVHPNVQLRPPVNPNSIGMGQLSTVDWTGPIEPLVREIAKASHYRLQVLGRKPAIPVLVSVHYSKPVPVATILRNAAFQCGNKVDIIAYPSRKILELRYHRV